jgi:hypothetical protein
MQVIMHIAKQPGRVCDDDYTYQGYETRDEFLISEWLAEKNRA